MNRIGFMQGRLTNKNGFFPQEFPEKVWEKEFEQAAVIGFSSMEWMFNADNWECNPIVNEEGIRAIKNCIQKSGIMISGVCANYFMKNSLYSPNNINSNQQILQKIVETAELIHCPYVILPLFEASEFGNTSDDEKETLSCLISRLKLDSVSILFETDVDVSQIVELINKLNVSNVGLCYDIGNATGLGKNVLRELETFSRYIGNVHIKDKKINGTSVMLGTGDAAFGECISCLEKKGYKGSFVLESYFGKNAIQDTKINYEYIKEYVTK